MPISEVYNEDCNVGMLRYPDKYFDLAIVDPPYFAGPNKRRYYGNAVNKLKIRRKDYPVTKAWDIPNEQYFSELFRVSKHQIVWGCNYYNYIFPSSGRIVWDKCNADSSFSDCEIAFCSLHASVRQFRYMWNGMMQGKSIGDGHIMQGDKIKNEIKIHPTQKPIALYKWSLHHYGDVTRAGQHNKILDTHMGSQSSRIAAYQMGFDYYGWEIDKGYFDTGNKRFELMTSQQTLFS